MANVDTGAELDEEDGAEAAEAAGKKKKLIMVAAAALVGALVIGGGASYMFGMFDGAPVRNATQGSEMVEPEVPPARDVVFYDLPEVTVNLAATGRATYLKVQISLEVADNDMIDQIEPFLPRVLDAFQVYLRELRPSDLEGSAGLFRLKEELLRRINTAVYPARVDGVLFKEILVQ
ncbi:flagellar basal body-associated FliL family protein [Breoghania sp. L-A4]|uniref:flagellar basal body-associated FliL family protein n=1 Tax=Breoghania sp. L-A4 TaxID=2304600 RepID=UPI000E35939C|nr:flagellar basal body-associated FliL family protein [Breoghania sp. L-A4]AXS41209.1 flagellar basal body-associated protein FliL [Breoghania sp. L-A4]